MINVKKIIISLLSLSFLVWATIGFVIYNEFSSQNLIVNFFDIGQGDAIYIKTPHHYQIIVDGGPDNTLVYKVGKYLPFYDREIDLLILTHPDSDHMLGFVELLRRYKIKRVLLTGITNYSPVYDAMLSEIAKQGVEILYTGQITRIDVEPGIYFEILSPQENLVGQKVAEKNDSSIVFKLYYNNISFLLTGDASLEIEDQMISRGLDVTADVLKLGHHGSKTSTGDKFLELVNPDLAIINVGQNKFGHPDPTVLAKLKHYQVPYLSTLDYGDIIISSNGLEYNIWPSGLKNY